MVYWWAKLKARWSMLDKKKKIIIGIICLIVLATAIYVPLFIKYRNSKLTKSNIPKSNNAENSSDAAISKLDGTKVSKELADRHPLAVIIDNHPDARPQTGLAQASIIYEALAEGGITRYMAIYGPRDVSKIGPVRSARSYFEDWLEEYDAFFAHAGGAQNSLTKIVQDDIKDLPQNQTAYWREKSNKSEEHTLFTSTEKLYGYAQNQKYDIVTSSFKPWAFKEDLASTDRPNTDKGAMISFSGDTAYTVEWNYDNQTNTYSRKLGNVAHKDSVTGEQLITKNIVILVMPRATIDSGGKSVNDIATLGKGKAFVMLDGTSIEGTWQKDKNKSRMLLTDNKGKEISFNAGPIWIEVINPDSGSYTKK